jgi:hypothetical protein
MLFNPKPTLNQVQLTGRNLAHGHRTPSQRAAVAADLVKGNAVLVQPTVKQAASLAGVCVPYTEAALNATDAERAALRSGELQIAQLKPTPSEVLVTAWNAAANGERVRFAKRVGVGVIFDEAIAPALG